MVFIILSSDLLVKEFDIDTCKLVISKHFKNTWMRKWDWDYHDLREAIRDAYQIKKIGKKKFEIYVRKKGEKKIIVVYYIEFNTLFIITGSEG
jgi:hypothetical protein